jgi:hypothetical protein
LGPDGKSKSVAELKLSQPLDRPDGMRAIGKNRLLLAENSGKMDIVTIEGRNATVKTIKEGLVMTPAVTLTRGMAWIVEGKLPYMNDAAYKDKDPGCSNCTQCRFRRTRYVLSHDASCLLQEQPIGIRESSRCVTIDV